MKGFVLLMLIIFLVAGIYASCNETQININTADSEDLDKIIWIGNSTANKIISYRETDIFNSLDELINIQGIGEIKLSNIKEQGLACVDKEAESQEETQNQIENFTEKQEDDDQEEDIDGPQTEETNNKKDIEGNYTKNEVTKPLTLETIKLNSESKDIKSDDNKGILKRNLAFAGIVTFCVIFGGALFLSSIRKNKNEFR